MVFEAMFHPELPPENNPRMAEVASSYVEYVKETIQVDSSINSDSDKVFLKSWAAVHGFAHLYSKGILQKTQLSDQDLSVTSFLDFLWSRNEDT